MADDIRQEFVFDAAKALKTIETLTSRYEKLNTVLRGHAKTVKGINTSTRKITGGLIQIKNAAKAAADQLTRVYGAKAAAATTKAAKGTTAAPPVDTAQVNKAKASLQELDAVARKTFAGAPIKNQKLFTKVLNYLRAAFHRSGGSVTDFKKRLAALDQQVNGTQARMRTAMRSIAKSTKEATNPDTLRNFTVSWQTMVRIVTTQLIVRSLNVLRQALRDSISEALDFSRAVAEIGTIAEGALGGLGDIAKLVRETSDAYGRSRLDVAEGLYQMLSNQVGDAAESIHVFNVANQLATTAVGSTEDAVNLLSAVLNSFQLSAYDAESVSAKLFRTIELGRTRMDELADTFGRIGPLANALGVSLDETLASIAVITVQGTRTAEALTQLRGVMQGMLKPSENMKKVFREIGVANAEAGIATWGFHGFLTELTKVTGTNSSEMGQLIRRVRGLLGAITLAGDDTEQFIDNLQQIQDTTTEIFREKYKLVFETPGEELLREFNKLKNILVVDIGVALVKATLSAVKFTKAMASVLPSIGTLATIITAALIPRLTLWVGHLITITAAQLTVTATSLKGWFLTGRAIKNATILLKVYRTTLLSTNVILAVILVAFTAITYAIDQSNKKYKAHIAVLHEAEKAQSRYNEALDVKKIEVYSKLERKRAELQRREINRGLAEAQKAYNERREAAQEADKVEHDSAKSKFGRLTDLLNKYTTDSKKKIEDLHKSREDSERRVDSIVRDAEQNRFDRGVRFLGAQQKLDAQRARGLKLQREASKFLATGDPEQIKRGLELYRQAETIFGSIRDIAYDQLKPLEEAWRAGKLSTDQFNNLQKARRADNAAHQLSVNLAKNQLRAEQSLQKILDERATKAKADLEHQQQLNAQLKTQFDIVLDNMKTLDKEGEILDSKVLKNQAEARGRAFEQIRNLASQTIGGLDLAEQLQLTSLKADIENAFSPTAIRLNEDALNTASDSVRDAFTKGMDDATTAWATKMSVTLGKTLIPDFDPARGFEQVQKTVQELTDSDFDALTDKQDEVARKQAQVTAAMALAKDELRDAARTKVPRLGIFPERASILVNMVKTMQQGRVITKEQTDAIDQQILKWNALVKVLPFGDWTPGAGMITEFSTAIQEASAATGNVGALRRELEILLQEYEQLGGAGKQAAIDAFLSSGANNRGRALEGNTQQLQTQLGIVQNQILPTEQTITAEYKARLKFVEDMARIDRATKAAPTTIRKQAEAARLRPQGFAKGGLVKNLMYLAKGNLARGTDTIPAMLSPGEFVMNSKSTRRFYSQLVAMNSGQKPIYRQEGGPVTNVSVGDVHVQGGKNPAQTGRQIVGAIKRELRRGTSSF